MASDAVSVWSLSIEKYITIDPMLSGQKTLPDCTFINRDYLVVVGTFPKIGKRHTTSSFFF